MATEYKDLTDQVVSVLTAEASDKLTENVTGSAVTVKKGRYVPREASAKPIVYVQLGRPSLIRCMAGNQKRDERLKFIITGATQASGVTAQEDAYDDCVNLMNNIQHVLENNANNGDYWSGGSLAWDSGEDESGIDFGEITLDPGGSVVTGHFTLMWACNTRIARDSL